MRAKITNILQPLERFIDTSLPNIHFIPNHNHTDIANKTIQTTLNTRNLDWINAGIAALLLVKFPLYSDLEYFFKNTFTLSDRHLEILSEFAYRLLTAPIFYTLLKTEYTENSFTQSLLLGFQKTAWLVILQIGIWILKFLRRPDISVKVKDIVDLFSPKGGIFEMLDRINVCVIVPFIEEYTFRAGIYKKLKKHINSILATICTNAFFSAIHGYDLRGSIDVFIGGSFLTVHYALSETIIIPIIMHGLHNLYVDLFDLCSHRSEHRQKEY